jgi:hypothetical protein
MDPGNDEGKWRYQIEVDGTGIREYYEYDERIDPEDVGEDWLRDAEERWSGTIAEELADGLEVTPLWQQKDQQTSEASEVIALPPPALEEE